MATDNIKNVRIRSFKDQDVKNVRKLSEMEEWFTMENRIILLHLRLFIEEYRENIFNEETNSTNQHSTLRVQSKGIRVSFVIKLQVNNTNE